MKRHRSTFNPDNPAPYELSRSRIENFVRCPACFYLQQEKAVPSPSIQGYNINEATYVLLKRDFLSAQLDIFYTVMAIGLVIMTFFTAKMHQCNSK